VSLDIHRRGAEARSNAEKKYKAYPEYKDSGVEWVGDIPENWAVKPLFGTSTSESVKNINGVENNVLSLSYGNIVRRDVDKNFGLLPESFNTYQIVECGDLILRLTDLQNDKRSLRVGHAKERGIITSAYLKLVVKKDTFDDNYLYRLLHSYDTTKVFYGMGGGLRQSMSFEDMRRLPVLVPSIEEQKQIANFLDHETTKIDTLIEKQQQLIKLLKEKRQAVISHAVTKGLNPSAPMKDSGIEWLGKVPAHWEVMPLKYAITFQRGHDLPAQDRVAGDVPLVSSAGISSSHNVAIARAPGLVTGRYGTIGNFNLMKEDYWPLNTTLYSINLRGNKPKYLWYMLHNLKPLFIANSLKSAVPGVDRNDLHTVKVAITKDQDEQSGLCDYLDEINQRYDAVTQKGIEQIKLLQERRTALISAAVTGKIAVRDLAKKENFYG